MPRSRHVRIATQTSECPICHRGIAKGMRVMKHYDLGDWVHAGCLIKERYPNSDKLTVLDEPVHLTENQFLSKVQEIARQFGWLAYHPPAAFNGTHVQPVVAGYPDLTLVHPLSGRLIFAELKSDAGKMTEAQERWLAAFRLTEAHVAVWRPADLPRIREVLEAYSEVPTY